MERGNHRERQGKQEVLLKAWNWRSDGCQVLVKTGSGCNYGGDWLFTGREKSKEPRQGDLGRSSLKTKSPQIRPPEVRVGDTADIQGLK